MEADLILLEKNPAEDISNIQYIDKVFLQGKMVYSQRAISSYNIPDYTYPEGVSVLKYTTSGNSESRIIDVSAYTEKKEIYQTITTDEGIFSEETFAVESNLS